MSAAIEFSPVEESVKFTDGPQIRLEATRYLFCAGNFLSHARRRERKDLNWRGGGEDLASPCAWRMKHFLHRAFITPFEVGLEHRPLELVPEGVTTKNWLTVGASPSGHKTLYGIPVLPGEHIRELINIGAEEKKGIVEIEALQDAPWGRDIVELQEAIFPADWPVPTTLREVEAQIRQSNADSLVADVMLESCAQFSQWGHRWLDVEHGQIKSGRVHQWTYNYSPLGLTLLEQLEVTRQDQAINMLAKSQADMMNQSLKAAGLSTETLTQLDESRMEQFREMLAMVTASSTEAMIAGMREMFAELKKDEPAKKVKKSEGE